MKGISVYEGAQALHFLSFFFAYVFFMFLRARESSQVARFFPNSWSFPLMILFWKPWTSMLLFM